MGGTFWIIGLISSGTAGRLSKADPITGVVRLINHVSKLSGDSVLCRISYAHVFLTNNEHAHVDLITALKFKLLNVDNHTYGHVVIGKRFEFI